MNQCLFGLLLSSTHFGCKAEERVEQALPVAPPPGEPVEAPPPDATVVEVRLRPAIPPGANRRTIELTALATGILEGGLADLFGVVPVVQNAQPAPGFQERLETGLERWTIDVSAANPSRDRFEVALVVCNPSAQCTEDRAGSLKDPSPAIAHLLLRLSVSLGRSPIAGVVAIWERPQSPDPYAVLVAGRAMASFYGLIPPIPPAHRNDRRLDPMERAIFIDPKMPLAQWIMARRRFQAGELALARFAFARAGVAHPQRLIFLAGEASTLSESKQFEAAETTWRQVLQRSPRDPRFAVSLGRASLLTGKLDEATEVLDRLPQMFQREAKVLRLRVDIAEARGRSREEDDELLAAWQAAAPEDPEPVRRRIAARVRSGQLEDALELVSELGRRGQAEEALRLELALEVSLGHLTEALQAARVLGMKTVEEGLALRLLLEQRPRTRPTQTTESADPVKATALGEAYLVAGDASRALAIADRVLAREPWLPEASLLRARSLSALGMRDEASRAATRVAMVDPMLARRAGIVVRLPRPSQIVQRPAPKIAAGNTRSSTQSQALAP